MKLNSSSANQEILRKIIKAAGRQSRLLVLVFTRFLKHIEMFYVNKIPTFYGRRLFITVFTTARHLFLSRDELIESTKFLFHLR